MVNVSIDCLGVHRLSSSVQASVALTHGLNGERVRRRVFSLQLKSDDDFESFRGNDLGTREFSCARSDVC